MTTSMLVKWMLSKAVVCEKVKYRPLLLVLPAELALLIRFWHKAALISADLKVYTCILIIFFQANTKCASC